MTLRTVFLGLTSVLAMMYYSDISAKQLGGSEMRDYFAQAVYVRKLSQAERVELREKGCSDFRYGIFEGESGVEIVYTHYEISALSFARSHNLLPMRVH